MECEFSIPTNQNRCYIRIVFNDISYLSDCLSGVMARNALAQGWKNILGSILVGSTEKKPVKLVFAASL